MPCCFAVCLLRRWRCLLYWQVWGWLCLRYSIFPVTGIWGENRPTDYNLLGGFLRLLFSFSVGLLMSRVFKPLPIRGAFGICSLAIAVLLSVPHIGGGEALWMNGIYDAVCVVVIFPLLVWLGASGKTTDRISYGVCKFLGDISYPMYIIHYPFMYLFYAWLWREKLTFAETWPIAWLLFFGNILLAYLCLKLYDEPVRKWLSRRFLVDNRKS